MLDNDLIRLFLPIINAGLIADGFLGVNVIQSNQPTQQGIPTAPTVYFFKVSDKRYGYPFWGDVWDAVHSVEVHTELQYYETIFQFSALVLQRPYNTFSYTAADLVNEVCDILQSANTVQILIAAGVGVLRVQQIRNPYFVDDMDNFEAAPAFELVLTYLNSRTNNLPVINLPVTIDTFPI
jgi:hypothetical protein